MIAENFLQRRQKKMKLFVDRTSSSWRLNSTAIDEMVVRKKMRRETKKKYSI